MSLLAWYAVSGAAQSNDYIIGPHDVLTVAVWGEPNLSGRFTVEADGSFTFPLIGRVAAQNLTLRAAEREIATRLTDDGILKKPQVSVTIEQYGSQLVFVVGEVQKPGSYSLTGDTSISAILARAGSTTATAGGEVLVVRPKGHSATGPFLPDDSGASEITRIDINDLHTNATSQNVLLRNGDTIFVPRALTMFVFGQVRNPGSYPIQKNTTVLQALALAGGLTERGSKSRLELVRAVDGKQTSINVKLTDLVRPGDTIVVHERFF